MNQQNHQDVVPRSGGTPPPSGWEKFCKLGSPLVPVTMYVVVILLCQYLASVPKDHPPGDGYGVFLLHKFVAMALGVPLASDPFVAILTGVNIVTVAYGLWYYTDQRDRLGSIPAFMAILLCGLLLFQNFAAPELVPAIVQMGMSKDSSASDFHARVAIVNVYREFLMAFITALFFAITDYFKSTRIEDPKEKSNLYFQSLYISTPTLIALGFAVIFHFTAEHLFSVGHGSSVAYVAGVSALIVLLSNITFALFVIPSYAGKLAIEIRSRS